MNAVVDFVYTIPTHTLSTILAFPPSLRPNFIHLSSKSPEGGIRIEADLLGLAALPQKWQNAFLQKELHLAPFTTVVVLAALETDHTAHEFLPS